MSTRAKIVLGIALGILLLLFLKGCDPNPVGAAAEFIWKPPHWDCPYRPSDARPGILTSPVTLSGTHVGVPEYHDCQFLIDESGTKYVATVGIFARIALDTLFKGQVPQPDSGMKMSSEPGIIRRLQGGREPTSTDPWLAAIPGQFINQPVPAARSLATLVSDSGDYPKLGIKQGVNCLYLNFYVNRWRAAMVYNGSNGTCPEQSPVPPDTVETRPYTVLTVTSLRPTADLRKQDIAPVARFEWDETNGVHYIGIQCGDEWCEIGPSTGFTPVPSFTPPSSINGTSFTGSNRRVFVLKGWSDRQPLALLSGNTLAPSGPVATIIPHPELLTRPKSTYQSNWMDMAYIYADNDSYKSKLNIETAALRTGAASATPNIVQARLRRRAFGQFWKKYPWIWESRIVSASGAVRQLETRYVDHRKAIETGQFHLVPIARWRWLGDDEKTWIACPDGCCTPH